MSTGASDLCWWHPLLHLLQIITGNSSRHANGVHWRAASCVCLWLGVTFSSSATENTSADSPSLRSDSLLPAGTARLDLLCSDCGLPLSQCERSKFRKRSVWSTWQSGRKGGAPMKSVWMRGRGGKAQPRFLRASYSGLIPFKPALFVREPSSLLRSAYPCCRLLKIASDCSIPTFPTGGFMECKNQLGLVPSFYPQLLKHSWKAIIANIILYHIEAVLSQESSMHLPFRF